MNKASNLWIRLLNRRDQFLCPLTFVNPAYKQRGRESMSFATQTNHLLDARLKERLTLLASITHTKSLTLIAARAPTLSHRRFPPQPSEPPPSHTPPFISSTAPAPTVAHSLHSFTSPRPKLPSVTGEGALSTAVHFDTNLWQS
ncbi:hypothetical protein VNO80_19256 [Phaseolus coccineus]|uniref:Uncharacterized protein n=1 Tax=Phaseolus coccineus TaxID=3886 RepID=A0AAN9MFT8_PHACN